MALILRRLLPKIASQPNLTRTITCRSKPTPDYRVRIAQPCDYDKVMDFMVETYMRREPSIVNIGNLDATRSPVLIHLMRENIQQGMTLVIEEMAFRCIVAAAINIGAGPHDCERAVRLAECCDCQPTRELLSFYAYCSREADPWGNYCVDNLFECAQVAVHPDHQARGLAQKLIVESWVLARDMAFRLFRIDASNKYTAKVADSYSWKCIFSIPYRRYFDNGSFPFKCVQEPHTEFKVYVDQLKHYTSYYPPKRRCKK